MRSSATQIRQFRPAEAGEVHALFTRLNDTSTYRRFFSVSRRLADDYVATLTDPALTLDAEVALDDQDHLVGVGSIHPAGAERAELALAVEDPAQGHGVGTALLSTLLRSAQGRHIATMTAYVQPGNHRMLELVREELPAASCLEADGVVTVTIPVDQALSEPRTHLADEVRS